MLLAVILMQIAAGLVDEVIRARRRVCQRLPLGEDVAACLGRSREQRFGGQCLIVFHCVLLLIMSHSSFIVPHSAFANQSARIFASLTSLPHLSDSLRVKSRKASGVVDS